MRPKPVRRRAATEPVARGRRAATIEARDVNLFYGDFHAVEDVT